jgi:hypothetical protein
VEDRQLISVVDALGTARGELPQAPMKSCVDARRLGGEGRVAGCLTVFGSSVCALAPSARAPSQRPRCLSFHSGAREAQPQITSSYVVEISRSKTHSVAATGHSACTSSTVCRSVQAREIRQESYGAEVSGVLPCRSRRAKQQKWLAGAPGFEPGDGGIKIRAIPLCHQSLF